jgi:predicted TIM-barrel fold metal-dependent hydrolase
MQGKIALEEHFANQETIEDSNGFLPADTWTELKGRLLDMQERRIAEMDAAGIEIAILSLNAPAIQAIWDADQAVEVARRANDFLAEEIAKNPKRYLGFAALPMQDPARAAEELRRCIEELGFVGSLVNGFSQVGSEDDMTFYDEPQFDEFWAEAARLDRPFYLHPRNPIPMGGQIYKDNPWLLGPTWAFGQETAVHALRLMGSGLFDRHPDFQVILGHMGEGIPFSLWRIDHRNQWTWTDQPHNYRAQKKIVDYFRNNFYLTTSGNFHTPTLNCAINEIGVDRVLFSADWPFENMDHAAEWFDNAEIDEDTRNKVGRDNCVRLFGL